LNFEQAKGAIQQAKNHPELLEAMRKASAQAFWHNFTVVEQRELRRLADQRNKDLADQARAEINQWEAKINKLVPNMGNCILFS